MPDGSENEAATASGVRCDRSHGGIPQPRRGCVQLCLRCQLLQSVVANDEDFFALGPATTCFERAVELTKVEFHRSRRQLGEQFSPNGLAVASYQARLRPPSPAPEMRASHPAYVW